jgi:hypothetical protein
MIYFNENITNRTKKKKKKTEREDKERATLTNKTVTDNDGNFISFQGTPT